ncbi:MAG: DUF4886 domain-containing protein [Oscillospiraceae bacterium]|nr:DUF4886 domain-containing protein [Oscillospiraceae bacterium]
MRSAISIVLLLAIFCALLCPVTAAVAGEGDGGYIPPISAPTAEDHEAAVVHCPTLADTTLRAGRNTLRKTVGHWAKYLQVQEVEQGLRFTFTKAVGTVFEGISRKVSLDGLRLAFRGFRNHKETADSPGTFAICFGKGEYERFAFGLILNPGAGTVQAAQASGASLTPVGDVLLSSPLLKAASLRDVPWSLSLSKEFHSTYTLTLRVGGAAVSAPIDSATVEQGDYDPTNCQFGIMAQEGLPSFSLILESWAQIPRPIVPTLSHTLLTGTGNFSGTLSDWAKWLSVSSDGKGLMYRFTNAAHSVTEAMLEPVSLKGLRIHFSQLSTAVPEQNGRFAVTFGTGGLVRSCFGLIFDFKAGRIYAAKAEVQNGTVRTDRVAPVGEPLFSGSAFTYDRMSGKEWYVEFADTDRGVYALSLCIAGESYSAEIPYSVVCAYEGFDPNRCMLHLMSGQNGTTLNIRLCGIVNRFPQRYIDNSKLLPAHVPVTQAATDENGTPEWFSSAIMMEVNIPRITKEGTLDGAVSVLDHIAETGVNCIWLTSLCEPGITNDGKAGNHYTNKGVQTIDPAITGCQDYEQGWQKLADFVEEAHKRNIYVIFNVITWGTTADSPLYLEHPQWYTGKDLWNGKAWDWNNGELRTWFQNTLVDIVSKTNVDGVLYDCEPQYAGSSICAQHRAAIRATGRNPVIIAETVNERSNAFDMELYGVMDYRSYTETWLAVGDHQKDDREFFIDEGNNIVDAVKNGTLSGTPSQQKAGTGGKYRYYSYSFSNHDSYYYGFKKNLLDVGYQGIFSSYIPIWYLGEEFNSTNSGIRLYFDQTNWAQLTFQHNREFFEQLKALIRIRREYPHVFEQMPQNHRDTNICKVETTGDLHLQAYGRYGDNTGILILGNHNADGKAVTTTVTVPFDVMELGKYDSFVLTDLLSGEVLGRGSRQELERFTVTLPYDSIGVYGIVGTGTAWEGVNIVKAEHALLRNGTPHEVNTATQNWIKYLQVEESPSGKGLRFSFHQAVTTVGEGIKVPLSLENVSLHFSNLTGYVNNIATSEAATIALSFGPGGYERNRFGLIFDFAKGAVYKAKQSPGTAAQLTSDSTALFQSPLLTADSLEGKDWCIQLFKKENGNYSISLLVDGYAFRAEASEEEMAFPGDFDHRKCYAYLTAAGGKPSLSFDLVGWGSVAEELRFFAPEDIGQTRGSLSVSEHIREQGMHLDFREATPLTGIKLSQDLDLDGLTLYFDDVSNYRNSLTVSGSTKFALTFGSANSVDSAFGLVFDFRNGKISLCLNGITDRELLSNRGLQYAAFCDVQWSVAFRRGLEGWEITLSLPSGTYTTVLPFETLSQAVGLETDHCRLSLLAWDGPLELSLRPVGYRTESRDVDGDGELEILVIGNSYTTDALWYAWDSARDLGVERLALANLYISHCSVQKHASNASTDAPAYLYYFNDSGTWKMTGNYKISTALTDRSWDYVVLQENHSVSGVESSYNENLSYLIDYVQNLLKADSNPNRNPSTKLAWHMTWAYQQDCTQAAFPLYYGNDQMTMYNRILSATQNKICTNDAFDVIIPSGTAVQNARTSLLGDTLTRDGYHMSTYGGRYMTGLMFLRSLIGLSPDHISYAPETVTAEEKLLLVEAVKHAYDVPFAVTSSQLTGNIPTSGYTQLDLGIRKGAYWSPTDRASYHSPITNGDNSKHTCASARFTREQLPVGSVLVLAEGWSYGPVGWYTDHPQSEDRYGTTNEPYVIVTPEWWGDDTIRAFNISRAEGGSVENATLGEIRGAFRVYVPTQGEFHTYLSETKAPTCTEMGQNVFTCPKCADSYSREVAPCGHRETVDKAVAPTCTQSGLTEGSHCSTCNEILIPRQTIPPMGHSYSYTDITELTHTALCEGCGYTSVEAHSFAEGKCICGTREHSEPVALPNVKLAHTLNLASDISVNFVIPKQDLNGFDIHSVYVECILDAFVGNEKTGTRTVELKPVEKGDYYYFTLTGLTAVQMNDSIVATLYGTKEGQLYASAVDIYSVATYAYSQMNNPNRPESLKILCADLLRYGAKAQIFKGYRTDALADTAMTATQRAYLSDLDTVTFGNHNRVLSDLPNPPVTWVGKALNLESKIALKLVFDPTAYQGDVSILTLGISYIDAYGNTKTATVSEPVLYDPRLGYYAFTVDSLLAAELRAVVSAQIYAGDSPVSATLQYSPDTYGNGKSGDLLELCKALFAYSDSARAYFA